MRVHLGSDHAGLELKDHLVAWLVEHGYEPVDHGPFVYDALDDYPVFCLRAAEGVAADHPEGVTASAWSIGGSGNGEQIAANKVRGHPLRRWPGRRRPLPWRASTTTPTSCPSAVACTRSRT